MEQELNIAAILKDKPKGTKLYSRLSGDCILKEVGESPYPICVSSTNSGDWNFIKDGKYVIDGEICLFPSKQMQDWSKFAWKKGDVLTNDREMLIVMFSGWANDDYTEFNTKYDLYNDNSIGEKEVCDTSYFTKASEDVKKKFIDAIEARYGGKLNLKTLEIEHEPQFKDGDIVCFYGGRGCFDTIAIVKEQGEPTYKVYAFLEIPIMKFYYQDDKFFPYTRKLRFATDSEKQQLFDALAKEGKRWNPETKTLEDLPKKCEFKPMNPMDLCLMRDFGETWKLCQFGFMEEVYAKDNAPYNAVGGNWYNECIPYNEETAHLLGTTDDWKGGEE